MLRDQKGVGWEALKALCVRHRLLRPRDLTARRICHDTPSDQTGTRRTGLRSTGAAWVLAHQPKPQRQTNLVVSWNWWGKQRGGAVGFCASKEKEAIHVILQQGISG